VWGWWGLFHAIDICIRKTDRMIHTTPIISNNGTKALKVVARSDQRYRERQYSCLYHFFPLLLYVVAYIHRIGMVRWWIFFGVVFIVNGVGTASVMRLVHPQSLFFLRHSEPSSSLHGVKHDSRRGQCPRRITSHAHELIPEELPTSTIQDSRKVFSGVLGVGKKGREEHAGCTGTKMHARC
jgi:hypothetical protein